MMLPRFGLPARSSTVASGRATQPQRLEAAVAFEPEPMVIKPEIDAGKVLAGLSDLGLWP